MSVVPWMIESLEILPLVIGSDPKLFECCGEIGWI
jgi:hypothetical protein